MEKVNVVKKSKAHLKKRKVQEELASPVLKRRKRIAKVLDSSSSSLDELGSDSPTFNESPAPESSEPESLSVDEAPAPESSDPITPVLTPPPECHSSTSPSPPSLPIRSTPSVFARMERARLTELPTVSPMMLIKILMIPWKPRKLRDIMPRKKNLFLQVVIMNGVIKNNAT